MPGRSEKVMGNAVTRLWALPSTVISYLIFGSSQKHSCFLAPSTDPRGELERNDPLQGHPYFLLSKSTLALENVRKGRRLDDQSQKDNPCSLIFFFGGGGVGKLTVTLRPQDKKRLKTKYLPSGAWDSHGGVLPPG